MLFRTTALMAILLLAACAGSGNSQTTMYGEIKGGAEHSRSF